MQRLVCPLGNSYQICKKNCNKSKIITRSGKSRILFKCFKCDFHFFKYNPKKKLQNNKLDISRLHEAGLEIPTVQEEFKNGLYQSLDYIKYYINKTDKFKNILEIGCGLGYFLFLLKKKNIIPYGLEVNKFKRNFVENKINIRCENELSKYKDLKFSKIFLFYSLEYISNPFEYLRNLKNYLVDKKKKSKGGKIIIITPNKNDILKDVLCNISYNKFFYEENSINYFSKKSLNILSNNIGIKKFTIHNRQGYSIINFFNWFLNNAPKKTGYVGQDKYLDDLKKIFRKRKRYQTTKRSLLELFYNSNLKFSKIAENYNLGNQLILFLEN